MAQSKRKSVSGNAAASPVKKGKMSVAEERKRAREFSDKEDLTSSGQKKAKKLTKKQEAALLKKQQQEAAAADSSEEEDEEEVAPAPKAKAKKATPRKKAVPKAKVVMEESEEPEEEEKPKRSSRSKSPTPPAAVPALSKKAAKAAPASTSCTADLFPFAEGMSVFTVFTKTITMFVAIAAAWYLLSFTGLAMEPRLEALQSSFLVLVLLFLVPFALSAVPSYLMRCGCCCGGRPALTAATAAILIATPKYGLMHWPGVKMLKAFVGL
jgi:hypothetical protein